MLEFYNGDSVNLNVSILEESGKPYKFNEGDTVLFTLDSESKLTKKIENGQLYLTHEETKRLTPGAYAFDIRIFDKNKNLVQTALVDMLKVKAVVNDEI